MMTSGKLDMNLRTERGQLVLGGIVSAGIFAILLLVVNQTEWEISQIPFDAGEGTTKLIGEAIMGDFLLPFEAASIILLIALIGAVLITRKEIKE